MIFVTVGAQMPFDRLVRAVDAWALDRGRGDVLAQIGETGWTPEHVEWMRFLEPERFRDVTEEATALVGHAGTGSILTALTLGKPILVMPRWAALGETRNDHQIATAERFASMETVLVARDETELGPRLDELESLTAGAAIPGVASSELLSTLREFIES